MAVRAPLKLLGTEQRRTQFQVLPIKITEALAKNQLQLFWFFFFKYETIFLVVCPASVLGVQHKILRHGVTSDIKQHPIWWLMYENTIWTAWKTLLKHCSTGSRWESIRKMQETEWKLQAYFENKHDRV